MTYPLLKTKLSFLSCYDENQVYSYFNSVRPSLIRVEADELTYNFHIAMRYELEKKMLQGTVEVSELPSVWNDMIEEYLGKIPPDDAQGVLQDVHWSWGQYANFPGYSLGNVIAGMHPRTQGMAGREAPQTRSNIPTQRTTQPSLRPWIRPIWIGKLSRKQVSPGELNTNISA
jgi:Zn-dependent M32 family carboxypeptidase